MFKSSLSCKGTDFIATRDGLWENFPSSSESLSEKFDGGGGGGIKVFLLGSGDGGLSMSSLSLSTDLDGGVTALTVRCGGMGGCFLPVGLPVALGTDTTLLVLSLPTLDNGSD